MLRVAGFISAAWRLDKTQKRRSGGELLAALYSMWPARDSIFQTWHTDSDVVHHITTYRSVAATDLVKVIFTSQKIQMLLKSTKGEIEVYLCPDPNDVPLPSENQLSPEEDTPNVIDFSTPPGMLVSLQHFPTIRLIANELLGLFIFHT